MKKKFCFIIFLFVLGVVSADEAGVRQRTARRMAKELETLSAKVSVKSDVSYLDDGNALHKLDIYSPLKRDKPFTVLVHIHGGGWRIGDKKGMRETGLFYASRGILFITPNYRLSPKVRHPAHVEDCAAALAWVFEHVAELGGDKTRVFLSGHSAGAHLAALLGTNAAYLEKHGIELGRLAGVIPVDTASFDFLSGRNEPLVKKLVKQAFGETEKVLKEASPFHNVKDGKKYPNFLIFNTSERRLAVKGGEAFAQRLKAVGSRSQFVPVPGHTHKEMAEGMFDAADPVAQAILKFISAPIP